MPDPQQRRQRPTIQPTDQGTRSTPAQPDPLAFDEARLLDQARQGDLDAFNQLVLRYQDRIYSIAYRLMSDPASAADMTQEAFLMAYRKLADFRGGSFRSWVSRIVTNRCYDELRRYQRRPADYLDDLPGGDSDDGPPLPADAPSPEQAAQTNELNAAVENCIRALGDDQRLVLVMADVEGQSYQEVADTLGINLGTVKSRLSRARLAVRRCLQAVKELLPPEFRLTDE